MRIVLWIVFIPVTILVIIFAVNNRQDVTIDVWPLMVAVPPLPVYVITIISLFVGFLWGGIVAWMGAGKARTRAREMTRQVETDRRDIAMLKEQIKKMEAAERPMALSVPPANAA